MTNNDTRNKYELIFVTTDDDPEFKHEWMNKKVVCINHYYICRRIDYYHCLAVRPFVENKIKWALPCIPVLNKSNKIVDPEIVHVCIIGGGNLDSNLYNLHVINRLKCTNKKIVLHVITRVITPVMLDILQKKNVDIAEIKLYNQFDTNNMFMLLQYCNYIFIDVTINNDHNIGYSMSGSTPIAFSSLSRLIISKQNNKLYKFSSALEFDSTTNDDIFIGDITVDIYELILQERDYLIKMFHNNVDEIIQKNQTMNHDGIYNYLIQNRNIV